MPALAIILKLINCSPDGPKRFAGRCRRGRKRRPDVPDFGKPITIGNLVRHTSGLRDWLETLDLSGLDMEGPISLEMILEMVRRQRELDSAPGEEYLYSNTGSNLLGRCRCQSHRPIVSRLDRREPVPSTRQR